jgi:hypothetical protein
VNDEDGAIGVCDASGTYRTEKQASEAAVASPADDKHGGVLTGVKKSLPWPSIDQAGAKVGRKLRSEGSLHSFGEDLFRSLLKASDTHGQVAVLNLRGFPAGQGVDFGSECSGKALSLYERLNGCWGTVDADYDMGPRFVLHGITPIRYGCFCWQPRFAAGYKAMRWRRESAVGRSRSKGLVLIPLSGVWRSRGFASGGLRR